MVKTSRARSMNIIFPLMICPTSSYPFLTVPSMSSRLNPWIIISLKCLNPRTRRSFRKIHFMTLSLIIVSLSDLFRIKFSITLEQILSIKVICRIKPRCHKVTWINRDFLSLDPGCLGEWIWGSSCLSLAISCLRLNQDLKEIHQVNHKLSGW